MRLNDYTITNYELIRDEIETGDIMLCSGAGLFSKCVKIWTKSDWSHVAMIIKFKSLDRIMIVESIEGIGFQLVPLSFYLQKYKGGFVLLRHPDFKNKVDLKKLGRLALDVQGIKYDTNEIKRVGWRTILYKLNFTKLFKLKFNPVNNDKYICSEAVKMLLASFGIRISYNPLGFITPSDFANWKKLKFLWRLK